MAYDDLLRKLDGEKYLIRLFLVFFLNGFPNALVTTPVAMMTYLPPTFRCIPTLDDDLKTNTLLDSNSSIIIDESQCFYKLSGTNTSFPCEKHSFENPFEKITAAMEFDWTCEKIGLKSLVLTLFFFGKVIGSGLGFLADKFGRKNIQVYSTLLMFILLLVKSFVSSTWLFGTLTFINSGIACLNYVVSFTLGVELTTPRHRNFICIASFFSFSIGYSITGLIAYLTPDWRWYYRVVSFFGLVYILNFWFVPESPRWLMVNKRSKEAKKVFQTMANVNGHVITPEFLNDMQKEAKSLIQESELQTKNSKKGGMWKTIRQLGKTPKIVFLLLVCSFSRISMALVYFGIAFNLQALSGNLFVNNALMGAMDVPGLIAMLFILPKLNRPLAGGILNIACGIFCIIAAFLVTGNSMASTVFGMIAKAFNAGLFHVAMLHTVEIFPTVIRNSCSSMIMLVGQIGSGISPSIILLGDIYGMFFPFLIMSLSAIISGVIYLLFLPNTKGKHLPETVNDIINMESLFSKCWKSDRKSQHLNKDSSSSENEKEVL